MSYLAKEMSVFVSGPLVDDINGVRLVGYKETSEKAVRESLIVRFGI